LATPTKKLHLAAMRRFFDRLVNRHVCVIDPAATVKAERHSVVEGKTPDIGPTQARALLKSIAVADPVGLRDRAVLAVLIYTAARVGAGAKLTMKNFVNDGSQYTLRFAEKGGKSRGRRSRAEMDDVSVQGVSAGT
jgi:integrase/recombinase XerD